MRQPFGMILAGGQGRRMGGRDKALLTLADRPLAAHVVERLAPQVAGLWLNANGPAEDYAALGLEVVPDDLPPGVPERPGPLAGVLAGLDRLARAGGETLVTVAADVPFVPGDLVPRLLLAAEGMAHPLAVAAAPEGGQLRRHPVCALWPVGLRDDLRAALAQGVRRIGAFAEEAGARVAFFPDGETAFMNVNTPEDLVRAEALMPGRGVGRGR